MRQQRRDQPLVEQAGGRIEGRPGPVYPDHAPLQIGDRAASPRSTSLGGPSGVSATAGRCVAPKLTVATSSGTRPARSSAAG